MFVSRLLYDWSACFWTSLRLNSLFQDFSTIEVLVSGHLYGWTLCFRTSLDWSICFRTSLRVQLKCLFQDISTLEVFVSGHLYVGSVSGHLYVGSACFRTSLRWKCLFHDISTLEVFVSGHLYGGSACFRTSLRLKRRRRMSEGSGAVRLSLSFPVSATLSVLATSGGFLTCVTKTVEVSIQTLWCDNTSWRLAYTLWCDKTSYEEKRLSCGKFFQILI